MNTFVTSAVTNGATDAALQTALEILSHHGFAIVHRDAKSADLTGPGLNSTRQNPLLGASKIHLELQDQRLLLNAELGGVDSMARFLMLMPLLLGLTLGLLFGVVSGLALGQAFGVGFGVPRVQGWRWLLVAMSGAMLPVSPWLILSPMMSSKIRTRTQNGLMTLVHNAVQLSGPTGTEIDSPLAHERPPQNR